MISKDDRIKKLEAALLEAKYNLIKEKQQTDLYMKLYHQAEELRENDKKKSQAKPQQQEEARDEDYDYPPPGFPNKPKLKKSRQCEFEIAWYGRCPEKNPCPKHANKKCRRKNYPGVLTLPEWICILYKNDFSCVECDSTEEMSLDHVEPLSQGGVNMFWNVQPLCLPCHRQKDNI